MIPSAYDGQSVSYIDAMKLQHAGVVVGQPTDSKWLFVQSANKVVKPATWHFRLLAADVKAFLVQ